MLTILAAATAVILPAMPADAQTLRACRLEADTSGGDYQAPGARRCSPVTTPPSLGRSSASAGAPGVDSGSSQETTDAERLLESALSK